MTENRLGSKLKLGTLTVTKRLLDDADISYIIGESASTFGSGDASNFFIVVLSSVDCNTLWYAINFR